MFKSQQSLSSNYAFTLIELSIVLVIIGLVVGGVLVSRDLVHAAELRSQIKQLQDYQTAFNTFQTKYNCIPGDCINATQFFGTTDASGNTINNGDGNGFVDTNTGVYYDNSTSTDWIASKENWGVIHHLSLANLISFTARTLSSYVINTGIPITTLNSSAGFFIGASYNFQGTRTPYLNAFQKGNNVLWLVVCSANAANRVQGMDDDCAVLTASDARAIDMKIDDGMPLTDKFFGFGGYNSSNDCLVVNGSNGSPLTTSTYKLSNSTMQCQAAYVIN